jgi:hypothetical protein
MFIRSKSRVWLVFNPSITQRINNLKEITDITSGGAKFKQDCKIEVEITRPNEDKSNTSI